jgi:methylase of polypeptide subunit release factors
MTNQETAGVYAKLDPREIAKDINKHFSVPKAHKIKILEHDFLVNPHVYPSHMFRSTYIMLEVILKKCVGKRVCEIGCGCGTLGQITLLNGASKLIQGDINSYAVENAKLNGNLHNFSSEQFQVFESDCFDSIPNDIFDVIIFAMPYHNDNIEIKDPLLRAFYDPNFISIRKFLSQVINYMHSKSEIYIAFSNKGDIESLEQIFDQSLLNWELYLVKNKDESYDNRVYKLCSINT